MKRTLLLFVTSIFIASCGGGGGDYTFESESAALGAYDIYENGTRSAGAANAEIPVESDRKIIRDGRMGVRVTELERTKSQVDGIVRQYGGYYSNENYREGSHTTEFDLVIRVPSANYESLVNTIENGDGAVLYKNIEARDVTEQYVDTEMRLANKRASLDRYRELLRRASNIEEILQVEEHIRRMEEEIEAAEGKLRLLNNQTAYSTLNLNISRENEYASEVSSSRSNFGRHFRDALSTGWTIIVKLTLALVTLWPLLLATAIVLFIVFRKRRKQKK